MRIYFKGQGKIDHLLISISFDLSPWIVGIVRCDSSQFIMKFYGASHHYTDHKFGYLQSCVESSHIGVFL